MAPCCSKTLPTRPAAVLQNPRAHAGSAATRTTSRPGRSSVRPGGKESTRKSPLWQVLDCLPPLRGGITLGAPLRWALRSGPRRGVIRPRRRGVTQADLRPPVLCQPCRLRPAARSGEAPSGPLECRRGRLRFGYLYSAEPSVRLLDRRKNRCYRRGTLDSSATANSPIPVSQRAGSVESSLCRSVPNEEERALSSNGGHAPHSEAAGERELHYDR